MAAFTATSVGIHAALAAESSPLMTGPGVTVADPVADGRDLFMGAFFLVGPEAAAVAEATQAPADAVRANQSAESVAYVEAITRKVGQLDPDFYAEFSAMLRSGDPFQVEQALDQGRQHALEAAEALGGAVKPPGSQDQTAGFFVIVVAIAVAAAASAVVGGNVVVLVSEFAVGSSPLGDDLGEEQAIAILTETFAA